MSVRIVVAGGGITGLAAAFTLRQEARRRGIPVDLIVLEAGAEAGGHARTIVEDGFVVERGPNGFLDRGVDTMVLIEQLGLAPSLVEANPHARRRFILQSGELRQVPESPAALLSSKTLSRRAKLRLLREPWADPPPAGEDETVFGFAERRLGREVADAFVDTAVAGITAGDSRALSVRSQFPVLTEWEREYGSLLKALLKRKSGGRPRLMSLEGGLGTLTRAMAARLNGALRLNNRIDRVERIDAGWRLHLATGSAIVADRFVCALPSHAAAGLAQGFDRDLAEALAAIPYADLSVVALAYPSSAVGRRLDGYGYLVTRHENLSTLGVLWESSIFPNRAPDGHVLLRAILGGTRRPTVSALDDRSVADLAVQEAAGVLGLGGRPTRHWVVRWPSAIA
ncbi:MAG TPA: protoporphyrinogen oxidase [Vicinamibacterales bacterium]|nr:protoporphyrinogen oxidase [Vicinamibacterales bacterium]